MDYGNQYNLPTVGNWTPPNKPNFLGSDFSHLKGLFTNLMAGDPNNPRYRNYFDRQLGRQSSEAVKNIKEQLASSGFRGAGANLINDIFETQANATEAFENDLAKNDIAIRQNAIAGLLGLNQFEGGQNMRSYLSDVQQEQFKSNQDFQERMLSLQQAFQQDLNSLDPFDVLGGILGVGAGSFLGGFGGKLGGKI